MLEKPRMLMFECNTGYVVSLERKLGDERELGTWIDEKLNDMYLYCGVHKVQPCVHVTAVLVSQKAADKLEVEELLFDSYRAT